MLTGGNAALPGFEIRLLRELRSLAPTELSRCVTVYTPPEASLAAWRGGSWWASGAADESSPAIFSASSSALAAAQREEIELSSSSSSSTSSSVGADLLSYEGILSSLGGVAGVAAGTYSSSSWCSLPRFADVCVTKAEWQEEGPRACLRKFGGVLDGATVFSAANAATGDPWAKARADAEAAGMGLVANSSSSSSSSSASSSGAGASKTAKAAAGKAAAVARKSKGGAAATSKGRGATARSTMAMDEDDDDDDYDDEL